MRKLSLVIVIAAALGAMPAPSFAQTAPSADTSARQSAVMRVIAVTSGAIIGMVATATISSALVSRAALVSLGLGGLAVVGTVAGGLVGNWLLDH